MLAAFFMGAYSNAKRLQVQGPILAGKRGVSLWGGGACSMVMGRGWSMGLVGGDEVVAGSRKNFLLASVLIQIGEKFV